MSQLAISNSWVRRALLFGALLATIQLMRFSALHFAVDDAWISFRIARNLVEHQVLTFNVGFPPVEGMSNLLWTLISAIWIALLPGVDPIAPARFMGIALHLATVGTAVVLAHRLASRGGGQPRVAAFLAAGLVAVSGSLAFYAMSGLETSLWGFLFLVSVERVDVALEGNRRAAALAGVFLGLLALCRPEGVLVAAIVCAWLVIRRDSRGWAWVTILPVAISLVLMESFRLAVYGMLVPNTFFAKPPDATSGWDYLVGFVLMGTGLFGGVAALPAVRRHPTASLLLLIVLIMSAGTVWSGGDWMPGYRRFTIPFLGLVVLAAVGTALATGRSRWIAATGVLCIFGGNIVGALVEADHARYNTMAFVELAKMANSMPGVEEVAIADIGTFGWHYRGSIFDLAGLTDSHIARLPGGHGKKAWDEAYFRSRQPDLVILQSAVPVTDTRNLRLRTRPFDTPVLQSMNANGGYRYLKSFDILDIYLVVFGRTDLELGENGDVYE